MGSYATVEEYRLDTGDSSTAPERVAAVLSQQSAKLRAKAGIDESRALTDDQRALCRLLVTDAARKCLVAPSVEGLEGVSGVSQASFSANGFQGSYGFANPSGSAYFDGDTLRALMRSLGNGQRMGFAWPGGAPC